MTTQTKQPTVPATVVERPILFSPPMVQAILAGTKTQTRRDAKLGYYQPCDFSSSDAMLEVEWQGNDAFAGTRKWKSCPYGHPGDLLWVRETWALLPHFIQNGKTKMHIDYKANPMFPDGPYQWKPSIHMRKEHARIWLEITGIKVERLLEINEEDALAEGVQRWPSGVRIYPTMYQSYLSPVEPQGFQSRAYFAARQSYIELWEKINGCDSTNANPWVWAISFKVLSTTGRPVAADQGAAAV